DLYEFARQVLDRLKYRSGTIKGLTIGNRDVPDQKRRPLYALVCETLKYARALTTIIERSDLLAQYPVLNDSLSLALVLTHDTLFTKKGTVQLPRGLLKECMTAARPQLETALDELVAERNLEKKQQLQEAADLALNTPPRYVRINLLKTTMAKVIQKFEEQGFVLNTPPVLLSKLKGQVMQIDEHLSDMLVFPVQTDLHDHPLFVSGDIILQDKASCFPATLLAPAPHAQVIDACAAPGNKTSHLCGLMANQGTIYAFDKDPRRLRTLEILTGKAGCRAIRALQGDFMEVPPHSREMAQVEYILLDPSCSGSGIVNRLDYLVDQFAADEDVRQERQRISLAERLANLAEVQVRLLNHAMTFPGVKRIVYSTCSLHHIENESVVARVLATNPHFQLVERPRCLPTWTHRGISGLPEPTTPRPDAAECVIRCQPDMDHTIGFFAALFERVGE
ncbi:S-adenosyl-L-methionine-dependent methyltransferase, partial [Dimargaris cristalligena]